MTVLAPTLLMIGCERHRPAATTAPEAMPTDEKALELYASEVAAAAQRLIELTPPDERALLVLPFDSHERITGKPSSNTPSGSPPFCAVLAWCLPGWGLPQGKMDHDQLVAMHKMLELALSPGGYQTLLAVLNRQRIIGEMEDAADPQIVIEEKRDHPDARRESVFDFDQIQPGPNFYPSVGGGFPAGWQGKSPKADFVDWVWDPPPGLKKRYAQFGEYTLAIFGQPGQGDWALRLEGHHVTVNVTFLRASETGETRVHATPLFFGAFPMIVPSTPFPKDDPGPEWNWEEGQSMMFSVAHHLRRFWLSLSREHQKAAFIGSDRFPQAAPLLMDTPLPFMISSLDQEVNRSKIDAFPHVRIAGSSLNEEARWHLRQAFLFYTGSMNPNVGPSYLARLDQALAEGEVATLAWAGGSLEQVGSHHYSYVELGSQLLEFLQGNQFTVQHDPDAIGSHVHSMLRDLSFDWANPMRSHHENDHMGR